MAKVQASFEEFAATARFDHRGHFIKRAIPAWVKRAVAARAGAVPGEYTDVTCHWCGAGGQVWWPRIRSGRPGGYVTLSGLEFDHVHPECDGGLSVPENIVLACRPCNRSKGHKVVL